MILNCKDETATQGDIDVISASKQEKENAINFLLQTGMIKVLKEERTSKILYRGVKVKDAKSKASMDKETRAVLSLIEEAKNEGIWTKTIERRTDLPQKVVTRCLKQLEKLGLIKPIKSVKAPTRKMYMMFHLTPSVEVTGGVWYHDQEFDSEFVKVMLDQIYGFIAGKSLPRPTAKCSSPIYARREAYRFPTISRIAEWLKKAGISDVKLKTEDIQLLLQVLEFDGRIERLPASAGLLEMSSGEDDDGNDTKVESRSGSKRKRKDASSDDEHDIKKRKKDLTAANKRHRDKGKGRMMDSDEESGADDNGDTASDTNETTRREQNGSVKSRRKKEYAAEQNESEDNHRFSGRYAELDINDAYVYRAIRTEYADTLLDGDEAAMQEGSIFSGSLFGGAWLGADSHLPWADAPCTRCPQIDFCQEGGPVSASGCEYFTEWSDPDRIETKSMIKVDEGDPSLRIEMEE
ncbi:34-kDa subunit of RNA polymerase III (C) [Serendipita sp. 411]|nr:34-kDa subunit of RNA polymerase III (C) [Serendipita sp. 411]